MKRNTIGLCLVVLGAFMLGTLATKAYSQFMTYTYTVKYTCFGRCKVQLDADSSVHDYINYEELQVQNENRRVAAEAARR